jgi:hypothetical protein
MLDPVSISTAIAAANTAFKTVQALVAKGKEVEDVIGAMGEWYNAAHQIAEADKQAQNPPLLKKLTSRQSVESAALEAYTAKKRLQQHRKELRTMINIRFGPGEYQQLVQLEKEIRAKRERAIYLQEQKRKAVLNNVFAVIAVVTILGGVAGTVWTLVKVKNSGGRDGNVSYEERPKPLPVGHLT